MTFWNWKAAVMSVLYRAPVFFLTSLKAGWRLAVAAMLAESVFRAITSGFYGAIVQALRHMEPTWLAALLISVVLPAGIQALEFLVHWLRGTPNLGAGIFVSILVSGIAALFNWYAMRRGTLLTGTESRPFLADLKSLPAVIFGFVIAGPVAIWRLTKRI
jgi:hypothetical protein